MLCPKAVSSWSCHDLQSSWLNAILDSMDLTEIKTMLTKQNRDRESETVLVNLQGSLSSCVHIINHINMSLRITWSPGRASQNRRAFVFIKHIHLYFFKWQIVSLDKTIIHRLVLFIASWSCTETVILTFNRLESIETNYMDTNPGMFSSRTLISFWLKKEIHKHLAWHGGE